MNYQDRVTEIANAVAAVSGSGVVHNRSRLAPAWGKYTDRFKDPGGKINGWEVTRKSGAPGDTRWDEVYRLRKFYGLQDAASSDLVFQENLDAVARRFRDVPDLSFGSVPIGLTLLDIDERMFGSVLVHFAECELPVSLYYVDL